MRERTCSRPGRPPLCVCVCACVRVCASCIRGLQVRVLPGERHALPVDGLLGAAVRVPQLEQRGVCAGGQRAGGGAALAVLQAGQELQDVLSALYQCVVKGSRGCPRLTNSCKLSVCLCSTTRVFVIVFCHVSSMVLATWKVPATCPEFVGINTQFIHRSVLCPSQGL